MREYARIAIGVVIGGSETAGRGPYSLDLLGIAWQYRWGAGI